MDQNDINYSAMVRERQVFYKNLAERYKNETIARLNELKRPYQLFRSPALLNKGACTKVYKILLNDGWVPHSDGIVNFMIGYSFYPNQETLTFFEA